MTIKNEVISEGIVLKSNDYKDSDAIISVYTKEYGRMSLIAKGVKKIKSKNASGVQTITHSEFTFIPKKGLSSLIKASYLNYYRYIKEDITLEAYASFFVEFVYKYTDDNEPDEYIYNNLKLALDYLEQGYHPKIVYLLFNAFILEVTGSPLQVDNCASCNHLDKIVGISLSQGGFVCVNCIGEYDRKFDKDFLKSFRHINRYPLSEIDKVKINEDYLDDLIEIMEKFIDDYTGISFKTRKFITNLRKL